MRRLYLAAKLKKKWQRLYFLPEKERSKKFFL